MVINKFHNIRTNVINNLKDSIAPIKTLTRNSNQQINNNKFCTPESGKNYTCAEVLSFIKNIMSYIKTQKTIDINNIEHVIYEIANKIMRHENILDHLDSIKNHDKYTFIHSINTFVFALALGKNLGMNKKDLEILGMGSILHDVGKCKIPHKILLKPGSLTNDEYDIMKHHSQYGYEILMNTGNIDEQVSDIVLHHHERLNGTGYPKGLYTKQINKFIRICAIADIYDTLISDRVYKKGESSHKAAELLLDNSPTLVDSKIMNIFSDSINIYPQGTRHLAMDYADNLTKELYICLSQRYGAAYCKPESFDCFSGSRLQTLLTIINWDNNNQQKLFSNFSEIKKEIREIYFKKIQNTLHHSDLELEMKHCANPVFKLGDIVKTNEQSDNIQSRFYFIKTHVTDDGVFGKILPISEISVKKLVKLNYTNNLTKYIRICKLRRLNPEY